MRPRGRFPNPALIVSVCLWCTHEEAHHLASTHNPQTFNVCGIPRRCRAEASQLRRQLKNVSSSERRSHSNLICRHDRLLVCEVEKEWHVVRSSRFLYRRLTSAFAESVGHTKEPCEPENSQQSAEQDTWFLSESTCLRCLSVQERTKGEDKMCGVSTRLHKLTEPEGPNGEALNSFVNSTLKEHNVGFYSK